MCGLTFPNRTPTAPSPAPPKIEVGHIGQRLTDPLPGIEADPQLRLAGGKKRFQLQIAMEAIEHLDHAARHLAPVWIAGCHLALAEILQCVPALDETIGAGFEVSAYLMVEAAARLRGEDCEPVLTLWRGRAMDRGCCASSASQTARGTRAVRIIRAMPGHPAPQARPLHLQCRSGLVPVKRGSVTA